MLLDFDPYTRLAELQDRDPERASIMEFDGAFSRSEAEASAARLRSAPDAEYGKVVLLFDAEVLSQKTKGRAA